MHDGAKGKDTEIWISCWDSLSQRAIAARDQTWGKDLGTVPSTARLGYRVWLVPSKWEHREQNR